MKILRHFAFGTFAASFIASSAVMAFASDPPSRVARLKYISGEVSMQPGGVVVVEMQIGAVNDRKIAGQWGHGRRPYPLEPHWQSTLVPRRTMALSVKLAVRRGSRSMAKPLQLRRELVTAFAAIAPP